MHERASFTIERLVKHSNIFNRRKNNEKIHDVCITMIRGIFGIWRKFFSNENEFKTHVAELMTPSAIKRATNAFRTEYDKDKYVIKLDKKSFSEHSEATKYACMLLFYIYYIQDDYFYSHTIEYSTQERCLNSIERLNYNVKTLNRKLDEIIGSLSLMEYIGKRA